MKRENEKIKVLFEAGDYATRKSINRSKKKVPKEILDELEQGVNIERINQLQDDGYIIFHYRTQITIHGRFPELKNNYIAGYKHIFQNQNESIGIKWAAIDEDKRRELVIPLKLLGFVYLKNSSTRIFTKTQRCMPGQDDMEKLTKEYQSLAKRLKSDLYYGTVRAGYFTIFGVRYIFIDLCMDGIYTKNIPKFLKLIGITPTMIEDYHQSKLREKEAQEAERLARFQEEQAKLEEAKLKYADTLAKLQALPKFEESEPLPGLYVGWGFVSDYKSELDPKPRILRIQVIYLYLPAGKKALRWNSTHLISWEDMLKYEPHQSQADDIYRGTLKNARLHPNNRG